MPQTGTDINEANLPYRTDVSAGLSGPLAGANKLWLPIWSGEVIHAYDQYNVFENLVDSRTISTGVAAEFPITGTVGVKAAWNAGEELLGSTTDSASQTISIKLDKRPMAAHFELDNVDLMITQWEYRSELARQAGLALANARDKQVAAYVARAGVEDLTWNGAADTGSQSTSLDPRGVNTGPVFLDVKFTHLGSSTANATQRTNAALAALKAIEDFFVYLQEINAPTDGVTMVVTPRAFQDIRALGVARDNTALEKNISPFFGGVAEVGGLGAQLPMGMNAYTDSLEYMGARIIKSSNVPNTNFSGIGEARYNLTFGNAGIKAMIFQRSCMGSLSLMGMKVDTVDDVRRNTVFTVASMMKGCGVLRPECSALLVGQTTSGTNNTAASYSKGTGKLFDSDTTDVMSELSGANEGGAKAALARNELRVLLGGNFSREFTATSATGFPYA
jgi:hypothetical protein